jgi:hypothetical protein
MVWCTMRTASEWRIRSAKWNINGTTRTCHAYTCLSVSPLRNRIIQSQMGIMSLFWVTYGGYYEDFGIAHLTPCGLVNKGEGGCLSLHSYPFATWLSLQPEKGDSIFPRNAGIHISNYTYQNTAGLKLGLLHANVAADQVAAISCNKIHARGCLFCVFWPKQDTFDYFQTPTQRTDQDNSFISDCRKLLPQRTANLLIIVKMLYQLDRM